MNDALERLQLRLWHMGQYGAISATEEVDHLLREFAYTTDEMDFKAIELGGLLRAWIEDIQRQDRPKNLRSAPLTRRRRSATLPGMAKQDNQKTT